MLEYNHCINTIEDFKDFIIAVYTIIDDIYREITPKNIKNRRNKSKSLISDSEIITISIIGELLTIDSENAWYNYCRRNFNDLFPILCDRSRFNRIRRGLHAVIDAIRKEIITEQLNIETVKAKSFWGLITRINTKILAYNLCCYINKLLGNMHLSKIKGLIF